MRARGRTDYRKQGKLSEILRDIVSMASDDFMQNARASSMAVDVVCTCFWMTCKCKTKQCGVLLLLPKFYGLAILRVALPPHFGEAVFGSEYCIQFQRHCNIALNDAKLDTSSLKILPRNGNETKAALSTAFK